MSKETTSPARAHKQRHEAAQAEARAKATVAEKRAAEAEQKKRDKLAKNALQTASAAPSPNEPHSNVRRGHARTHMSRHVAAAKATDTTDDNRAMATGYELMLAQLGEHKRRLREIKSNEAKAEAKARLLPDYDAYIAAALATDAGGQDDVLSTLMVWHIDAGNYAKAIEIGAYVIRHGLAMPDQYKRDPAGALVEETADAALKAKAAGEPFDVTLLANLDVMTEACDMHDEIRAKLHKAIGLTLATDDADQIDLEAAVKHLTRALDLHDKSGVKRDIELIQRRIKALGKEQAGANDGAG